MVACRNLIESDNTICYMYTTVSSWRWALEARNMYRRIVHRSHSSCVPTGHHELWQYLMLHVYNCILLKMSTWGWKHVQENSTQFSLKLCTDRYHELLQYHMLHIYNCILLKMSTWGSKHVEKYNILWINNNQCIKLVINIWTVLYHLGEFQCFTKNSIL